MTRHVLDAVRLQWLTLLMVLVSATPLSAHVLHGQATGFLTGFGHPISGLDHVLAMIAVGLWGAQLGAPAVWLLPVTFPMVMAIGGFMALVGIPLPAVEIGIAASALLLGSMVAFEARPNLGVAGTLVGVFAVFHGHAHGVELPAGANGLTYSIGFVVATGCLHAVGILFGGAYRWTAGKMVLRLTGVGIAAAGVAFFWSAVR
ncbi:MAG TPA: HupE/UreJ family protein [Vicinamibacterales bacterium]|nr:HupE/UreJ family protein [Vicinamibacterales bacterium]